MKCLIDSDWVADYLKGRPQATSLFSVLGQERLAISLITFGEIYEGIYYGQNRAAHEAGFRRFLRLVDVLPLNRSIMQQFARIRGGLRHSGLIISDPDILIAATAVHHNLTLLTRNLKDFQRVPDLRLYQFVN